MTRLWTFVAVAVGVVAVVAGGSGQPQDATGDAARPRRAPSGFLGMRGKKDAPASEDLYSSLYEDGMPLRGKKTPSGFLGMRGKKADGEEVFGHASDDSDLDYLLKRAPSGFLGMRGKKTPSGFLGMRGKKSEMGTQALYPDPLTLQYLAQYQATAADDDDYYLPEMWRVISQNKRAPSGFLGMRGKKDAYFDEEAFSAQKRTPSGFLGMRG